MASTFLLDASVLIFVFVPLDALIQFGRAAMKWSVFVATLVAAAFCFGVAYIMAVAGDEL
jgi:hypothetical protein